jgi:hypothetical protein
MLSARNLADVCGLSTVSKRLAAQFWNGEAAMRGLSGLEAVARMDTTIVETRRMLSEAIAAADAVVAHEAEVRGVQVQVYRDLAGFRLSVIDDLEPSRLDRLSAAALELLDQHDKYVAWEKQELAKADTNIAALEVKRADAAKAHSEAVRVYETKVAEIAGALKAGDAYKALSATSEKHAAIAARAHQKRDVARAELEAKGAPYKADKLFGYLWRRRFRTPDYKAGPFIRFLDGWVASLCKYDQAWMNFQRLSQLPEWLAEHAGAQDAVAAQALAALEAVEKSALEQGGAGQLQRRADDALQTVRNIDLEIDKGEVAHQAIAARHASAQTAETGPAREARRLLEDGLKRASFQDLRTLAAETVAIDDDRLVDRLVKLRTEEMSLELDAKKLAGIPDRLRMVLAELEDLRRRFKQARFDGAYAVFNSPVIDDVIMGISQGRVSADQAIEFLARSVRRIEPAAEPGFGGQPRAQTIGLPNILGEILWEIAKESSRGGGGRIDFPSGGGGLRSPRVNFPTGGGGGGGGGGRSGGGGKSGGFKTGGGF